MLLSGQSLVGVKGISSQNLKSFEMTIGAMSTYDERGSPELTAGQKVEVPKSTITKDSETAAFLDSKMENTKEPRVNKKFFDTHTNVCINFKRLLHTPCFLMSR